MSTSETQFDDEGQLTFDTGPETVENIKQPDTIETNGIPANKNKLLIKLGAGVAALTLVGAGAFAMLKGGEVETVGPENTSSTSAPAIPGQEGATSETPKDASPIIEAPIEELTLQQQLDQFVDEKGMPNKKIDFAPTTPSDALGVYLHNAACAINTRDIECVNDITTVNNPLGIQKLIDKFGSEGWYFRTDINEIINTTVSSGGTHIVTADITEDILLLSPTSEGHNTRQSIHIYEFSESPEGTFTASKATLKTIIED